MTKDILCGFGVDVDAVAGWLGSYGGEDSPDDISRGMFSGEVGALGDGVTSLSIGDNVVGTATFGAYAEHVLADAAQGELTAHLGQALAFEAKACGDEKGLGMLGARQQVGLAQARVEDRDAGVHAVGGDSQADFAAASGAVQHHDTAHRPETAACRGRAEVLHLEVHKTVVGVQRVGQRLRMGRTAGRCRQEKRGPCGRDVK